MPEFREFGKVRELHEFREDLGRERLEKTKLKMFTKEFEAIDKINSDTWLRAQKLTLEEDPRGHYEYFRVNLYASERPKHVCNDDLVMLKHSKELSGAMKLISEDVEMWPSSRLVAERILRGKPVRGDHLEALMEDVRNSYGRLADMIYDRARLKALYKDRTSVETSIKSFLEKKSSLEEAVRSYYTHESLERVLSTLESKGLVKTINIEEMDEDFKVGFISHIREMLPEREAVIIDSQGKLLTTKQELGKAEKIYLKPEHIEKVRNECYEYECQYLKDSFKETFGREPDFKDLIEIAKSTSHLDCVHVHIKRPDEFSKLQKRCLRRLEAISLGKSDIYEKLQNLAYEVPIETKDEAPLSAICRLTEVATRLVKDAEKQIEKSIDVHANSRYSKQKLSEFFTSAQEKPKESFEEAEKLDRFLSREIVARDMLNLMDKAEEFGLEDGLRISLGEKCKAGEVHKFYDIVGRLSEARLHDSAKITEWARSVSDTLEVEVPEEKIPVSEEFRNKVKRGEYRRLIDEFRDIPATDVYVKRECLENLLGYEMWKRGTPSLKAFTDSICSDPKLSRVFRICIERWLHEPSQAEFVRMEVKNLVDFCDRVGISLEKLEEIGAVREGKGARTFPIDISASEWDKLATDVYDEGSVELDYVRYTNTDLKLAHNFMKNLEKVGASIRLYVDKTESGAPIFTVTGDAYTARCLHKKGIPYGRKLPKKTTFSLLEKNPELRVECLKRSILNEGSIGLSIKAKEHRLRIFFSLARHIDVTEHLPDSYVSKLKDGEIVPRRRIPFEIRERLDRVSDPMLVQNHLVLRELLGREIPDIRNTSLYKRRDGRVTMRSQIFLEHPPDVKYIVDNLLPPDTWKGKRSREFLEFYEKNKDKKVTEDLLKVLHWTESHYPRVPPPSYTLRKLLECFSDRPKTLKEIYRKLCDINRIQFTRDYEIVKEIHAIIGY